MVEFKMLFYEKIIVYSILILIFNIKFKFTTFNNILYMDIILIFIDILYGLMEHYHIIDKLHVLVF
jgi:hypothetical protein